MLVYNHTNPGGVDIDARATFSPQQQAAILANRRAFELNATALGHTLPHGRDVLGNAYSIPRETWKTWDMDAVRVQRETNAVYNDLVASVGTPVNVAKMLHMFSIVSDSGEVNVSMDGRSNSRTDQQTYSYAGTPLPILDSTFSYGWRQVAAAQSEGEQLDPVGRDNAVHKVMNKLETIVLDGISTIKNDGNQLYGLRTHPKRETRTTGNALASATGAQWLAEIIATLKLLHGNKFKVPATIYLNWDDWFYATTTEYTSGYPKKISQAVLEIPGIASIVPSDSVTASQIIAVVKNRGVVEVLNGMPVSTTAKFRANPQDDYNFVTMAAAALQIRYDANDNCGVAVSTI